MRSLLVSAFLLAVAVYLYPDLTSTAPEHAHFFLFGTPIAHSLSPTFHNTLFASLDLPKHSYSRHETPTFSPSSPSVLNLLKASSFSGAAVTMPHKVAALEYMDELADEVKEIGSLNTVVVGQGGRLIGRNTDVDGIRTALLMTLPEEERRKDKPFGQDRNAIITLPLSPLYLINRDPSEIDTIISTPAFAKYDIRQLDDEDAWTEEDAEKVACGVGAIPSFEPETEGEKMVYRVAERVFETSGKLKGKRPFMEMAYKPHKTLMYNLALKHGWHPIGGIEGLIYQAAAQQAYWLLDSPVTRIKGLTEERLREAVVVAAQKVREEAGAPEA
ncbi:hypothetical protein JCM11641_001690 [Rhodosporidiobolus odoratus]